MFHSQEKLNVHSFVLVVDVGSRSTENRERVNHLMSDSLEPKRSTILTFPIISSTDGKLLLPLFSRFRSLHLIKRVPVSRLDCVGESGDQDVHLVRKEEVHCRPLVSLILR